MKRGKSETWRDFTGRWETPLRKAREHHIELREAYLVFLFIHGLGLSDGEIRNMLVFTQGEIKPKAVQSWLRKSETKLTVDKVGADGKETKKILLMEGELQGEEDQDEIFALEETLADLQDYRALRPLLHMRLDCCLVLIYTAALQTS